MKKLLSLSVAVLIIAGVLSCPYAWAQRDMVDVAYYPSLKLMKLAIDYATPIPGEEMLRTPDGKPGLRAQYFTNVDLEGAPAVERIDPSLNFRWGRGSPDAKIARDKFSARWTGKIGPMPGPYELVVTSDDGVRVWIDGKQVIDEWVDRWPTPIFSKAVLETGKTYDLRIEYFENSVTATCVMWLQLKGDTQTMADWQETASVTVLGPDDNEVLQTNVAIRGLYTDEVVELGELEPGTYTVVVTLEKTGGTIRKQFTRVYFPWEGNRLGITNRIYPPFEPITADGKTVSVVLRDYVVGGLGLWDSIKAAGNVSAGGPEELLAGPIVLRVNDGQVLQGNGRFTSTKPHAVEYEGQAAHEAVTVRTHTTTEYDGCMRVEMQLLPGTAKKQLQALWLEIPLKDSMAPLWHVTGTGIRGNPGGYTPEGEGVVWDSRTPVPDRGLGQAGRWETNFKCFYWLGAEERGFSWFADNDKGWVLDLDDAGKHVSPAQEIIRKDGVLTLKVNFVQRPVTITEPRTIVFGMIASPVKPMPADWRRTNFRGPRPGYKNIAWMGSQYWGSDENWTAKYPRHGDASILKKMHEARLGSPVNTREFQKAWARRNLQPGQPRYTKDDGALLDLVKISINHATWADADDLYNVYWEGFAQTATYIPEYAVFGDEWDGGGPKGYTGGLVPSYRDFAVWWGAEFLRCGIGLYFDNVYPIRAFDPLTTAAYRMPNGSMQPSATMWERREYLKRIWILHQQLAYPEAPTIMMIHMTNTHITPYLGWNESNLDLEYVKIATPQQARFHHSFLRAQSIGRQTGNIPLALAQVAGEGTPEQKAFAYRSRFGIFTVHEIKSTTDEAGYRPLFTKLLDFGYGLDDCSVYNYWDDAYPLRANNDDVKTLLLRHNGEVMIVVCTWNKDPEQVKLTLDTRALGVNLKEARNAENDENIAFDGRTITLDLEGYAVRVLHVK